jgi:flap endonuclease-1
LAILVGTDFNSGIKGIGPKTALRLVKEHGGLEDLPENYRTRLPDNVDQLRQIFLKPQVVGSYDLQFRGLDEQGLRHFLCEERNFSEERVNLAVQRMREFYARERSSLKTWLRNG